jgi:hypothetical protein
MILYRPVGLREMELIAGSGFREFPPRGPDGPGNRVWADDNG